MPNNLGELIEMQRTKLGLQQKQVAKMVGITNVSLCKVQTGERKLSRKKLKILADVLQVSYIEVLKYAGYDTELEYKYAGDKVLKADKNLILLLDELVKDNENTEILEEVISILNKSTSKDKTNLKRMLQLLKLGLYNSEK